MYRAAVQQEEQHTPAFLRMQQQAQVKEAEEEAEKKRIWEEEVASKKFWVCLACHPHGIGLYGLACAEAATVFLLVSVSLVVAWHHANFSMVNKSCSLPVVAQKL